MKCEDRKLDVRPAIVESLRAFPAGLDCSPKLFG